MSQSQHGYQINEFIERNLGRVSNMKKSTAYSILKRLEKSGDVISAVEQEGNRPMRQIYTITDQGKKKFEQLLRKVLSNPEETVPAGNIGIMFLDHLSFSDVLECLKVRLEKVEQKLKLYDGLPKHGREHGIGVDLAIEHRVRLMKADRDWLIETIDRLRKEAGGEIQDPQSFS